MRPASNYNKCIKILQDLHKTYPNSLMSMHLATALDGYKDIWGISDKELLYALEKYQAEQELDITPAKEVDQIIKEGLHLETMFKAEDDLLNDEDFDIREYES